MSDTPLKRCSKGDQCVHPESKDGWLQRTQVYFHKDSKAKDGFCGRCKACVSVYQKGYHLQNRDRINQRSRDYRTQNRERRRASDSAYYRRNSVRIRARTRLYYAAHKDRAKQQAAIWKRRNPGKVRRSKQGYYIRHKDKALVYTLQRFARKLSLPDTFTLTDWRRALDHFGACVYCGVALDAYHADHFIPLSSPDCPGTVPTNMLPACPACNLSKSAADPRDWLIRKFGADEAERILARILAYFASLTQGGT